MNLIKEKQPELIIEAFAEIRKRGNPVQLCMIGYGNLKSKIQKLIIDLELESSITLIRTHEVLRYYLESKIFILASLAEGIPCAMMEAMACELNVIVPPVGDITDIIKHGENGYLHNNSKDELVNLMFESYKNYHLLGRMRYNARKIIINQHSYHVATSKWNELLLKI